MERKIFPDLSWSNSPIAVGKRWGCYFFWYLSAGTFIAPGACVFGLSLHLQLFDG